MRVYLHWRTWAFGRELHPFCGDWIFHLGPVTLHRRMTARDYQCFNAGPEE